MQPEFWHERWAENRIGFHESQPNPFLVRHFALLGLPEGSRVFVPLAGKSNDLHWLAGQGYQVVGIELDESAVKAFFAEAGVMASVGAEGPLAKYEWGNIELYAGDIFDLTRALLGSVEAVYDRAALIALPDDMRRRYAAHLVELTRAAPQFLIALDYDQSLTDGPPFSVPQSAIRNLYEQRFDVALIDRADIAGPLGERCKGYEEAWQLSPRKSGA